MAQWVKCRWIISSPDGVSVGGYELVNETRSLDNRGREVRMVADKSVATQIVVNNSKNAPHHASGQILQPREFMVQLTEHNKKELIRQTKKGYICLDDIDLERKLLKEDMVETVDYIEVESEPVMVEEAPKEGTDSAKELKKKERLARLKGKVKETAKG